MLMIFLVHQNSDFNKKSFSLFVRICFLDSKREIENQENINEQKGVEV